MLFFTNRFTFRGTLAGYILRKMQNYGNAPITLTDVVPASRRYDRADITYVNYDRARLITVLVSQHSVKRRRVQTVGAGVGSCSAKRLFNVGSGAFIQNGHICERSAVVHEIYASCKYHTLIVSRFVNRVYT